VNDGVWQVSLGGGSQPHWSRSGRELFFISPDGAIMGVPVETTGKVFVKGSPVRLISKPYFHSTTTTTLSRQYDVSLDDQRFLVIKEQLPDANRTTDIVVVQNWFEELKQLVPAK
jgi:hypothetical protein